MLYYKQYFLATVFIILQNFLFLLDYIFLLNYKYITQAKFLKGKIMNKRDLQRLEGLLLLNLLYKTKNKRFCASVIGISVDTLTKYINFLEDDIGTKFLYNHKNSCTFTQKGSELISKTKTLDIENWELENKKINIFDLKNIKGIFYLKAISFFGNKRNASLMLATSVETINLYIDYLQNSLQIPLMKCDNQGSYLTDSGTIITLKFDRITKFLDHLIKQKCQQNNHIRLALEKDIDIAINSFCDHINQDITVFKDNPDLHPDDWDIAISFFKPLSDNMVINHIKKIKCGFFASVEYLSNFGMPKNLDDIKQNHLVIDGRMLPFADKSYCEFIDDCRNTRFVDNSNIAILDTASYGGGICLAPLTTARNNLVYLEHLNCNIEANLYLFIHKSFCCIPKYQQAMSNYREALNLM